jgi:hypothetical protein
MGCRANWQGRAFLISMFDVRLRNGITYWCGLILLQGEMAHESMSQHGHLLAYDLRHAAQAAMRILPASQQEHPMLDEHGQQLGIHLAQDAPGLAAAPLVQQGLMLPQLKEQFNGTITNDKFCMSRTARLQLSYWRLPRSARQTSNQGVQSSVEENFRKYLPQQETYEKTTMES